jgi:hypothetical protein
LATERHGRRTCGALGVTGARHGENERVHTCLARADECDPEQIEDDDLYGALIRDPQLPDRGEQLAEEYRALAQRAFAAQDAEAIAVLVRYATADLEPERRWYLGQLAKLQWITQTEAEEIEVEPDRSAPPSLEPGFRNLLYHSWLDQHGRQQEGGYYPSVAPQAPALWEPSRPEPPAAGLAQLRGYAYLEPPPRPPPSPIETFANWLARLFGTAPGEPAHRPD